MPSIIDEPYAPYPPEFIARAKALYPADRGIHELLDKGDIAVGKRLEIEKNGRRFNAKEMLAYLDKKLLYYQWCELRPSG